MPHPAPPPNLIVHALVVNGTQCTCILPESEGPGDGIIAVNHGEDSLGELVDARNLIVMLPRLLRDFQDVEPQQVTPTIQ